MFFQIIQVKLSKKINHVHLGIIRKSMGSVIRRMCLKKRKRTQLLTNYKTFNKTYIAQQIKHHLRLTIIRHANIWIKGKWMGPDLMMMRNLYKLRKLTFKLKNFKNFLERNNFINFKAIYCKFTALGKLNWFNSQFEVNETSRHFTTT